LQAQQQNEVPGGLSGDSVFAHESESEGSDDELDEQRADERKAARTRRHLEQKWSFPLMPGRRLPAKSLDLEFMKALVQVLSLEECLAEQVYGLRERICQKLKVSSFGKGIAFENPCFPLILRDVVCPWCSATAHIDITSHPTKLQDSGRHVPGQWICLHCKKAYDKDAVQARLVDLLETVVQAWQSQEITCRKCHRLRQSLMQTTCECFGLFQARFKVEDYKLVLRILRSLVVAHDLPWLGETLDVYEPLM
jgi:DNA polymerase epsilon subunit 1